MTVAKILDPRVLGIALLFSMATLANADMNLHALVVGNGEYKTGKLRNPVNDAGMISKALKGLGFEVTQLKNAGQMETEDAILKFSRSVGKDGLAFFFFAGHGVQVKGENYLIPTDARIREEFEVRHQCISLSLILDALENSSSNLNVVVLDCCRDNPFARSWSRSSRAGLAATTEIPEGTLIAFATPPGQTAADGSGSNSPFTAELAAALSKRPKNGLLLRDAFFEASRKVKQKAGQSPWVNMEASLDKFYLTKPSDADDSIAASSLPPSPTSVQPTESLTDPVTKPLPTSETHSSRPSIANLPPGGSLPEPPQSSLERQANAYLRNGDYTNAIEAFSAMITNPTFSADRHTRARKARGSAYLSRGRASDLERAIIDYKAAGLPGIRIPVRVDSSPLKVGKQSKGTATRNQILLVTLSQGDWLWVDSVNDDDTLKGYIKKEAVLAPSSIPNTSSPIVSSTTRINQSNGSPIVSTQSNLPAAAQSTLQSGPSKTFGQPITQVQPGQPNGTIGSIPSQPQTFGPTGIPSSDSPQYPQHGQTAVPMTANPNQTFVQPGQTTPQQGYAPNPQSSPQYTQQPLQTPQNYVPQQTRQYTQPQQNYSPQPNQQYTQPTQTKRTFVPQQKSQSFSGGTRSNSGGITLRDSFRDSFMKSYNRTNQIMRPTLPSPMRTMTPRRR